MHHHIALKSKLLGGKGLKEAAELLCAEQILPLLKMSLGVLSMTLCSQRLQTPCSVACYIPKFS